MALGIREVATRRAPHAKDGWLISCKSFKMQRMQHFEEGAFAVGHWLRQPRHNGGTDLPGTCDDFPACRL
ncbi:hypothetical protein [Planctomicrobium sp. SH664]|uniref:hypothetical protein n=1 Tax=Planctomicrobium sp. SH664 TaxID=3448125 RepID=UPI003F5C7B75